MSRYITVSTDVDVYLEEIDTEDLIEELESRRGDYNATGVDSVEMRGLLEKIWLKRREGREDYQAELDKLIYDVLGKII